MSLAHPRISPHSARTGRANGREGRIATDVVRVLPAALALDAVGALNVDREFGVRRVRHLYLRHDEQTRQFVRVLLQQRIQVAVRPRCGHAASSGAPMNFSCALISSSFSTRSRTSISGPSSATRSRPLGQPCGQLARARETGQMHAVRRVRRPRM